MQSVLLAERTILVEFDSIRIVLLVLVGLIVAALALSAGQRNCIAHFMHSFWLDYWDTTKCHWYNLSQIPTHVNNFIRKYWQSWHFIYRHNKTPHKQGVKSHSWWLRRDLNSWHSGYEPNALANWATQPKMELITRVELVTSSLPRMRSTYWAISAIGCGKRTRTSDLRVMSPTSYLLLHPAMINGGQGWIRTIVAYGDGFTVRSL